MYRNQELDLENLRDLIREEERNLQDLKRRERRLEAEVYGRRISDRKRRNYVGDVIEEEKRQRKMYLDSIKERDRNRFYIPSVDLDYRKGYTICC